MKLSIIIPTLNEADYLTAAIGAARSAALDSEPEIVVSDCGSADGTAELARRLGARVVVGTPPAASRAAALNQGARAAAGDALLFLDADTLAPPGYDRRITQALARPGVVAGAFEFRLNGPGLGLRLVELINRVRYRLWPWYYGDQGIFARTDRFHQTGGYPEQRLLESAELCRRLGQLGRVVLLHQCMTTSARRFTAGGVYRVLAHDAWIWWLDLLGRETEQFGAAYQQDNQRRGWLSPANYSPHQAEVGL